MQPHLAVTHPPQLDRAVVSARHNEGHGGVEGSPVHAAVVTFEHLRRTRHASCARVTIRAHASRFVRMRHSSCARVGSFIDRVLVRGKRGEGGGEERTCLTTASLVPNKSDVTLPGLS